MDKKVAMIVGNNFEEIEMVSTIDVLRRAKIKVEIISLFNQELLTGAHQIQIKPDKGFKDFQEADYQGIILPGGAGVDQLDQPLIEQDNLVQVIQQFAEKQKMVAAICAAPQVLGKAGILKDVTITHFPESDQFLADSKTDLTKPSVVEKNIITGRSAGTAIQFALNIVEYLTDKSTRDQVEKQLVITY